MAASGQFFDADGDLVSLKLTGAGTLDFALDQPDDKGRGALDHLTLAGTDARSVLSVTVQKVAGGNGLLNIGSIDITGALRGLSAPTSNLIGTGLTATGALGGVALRDLTNGADIVLGGAANSSTVLVLGNVGTGSDLTVGGKLSATVKSAADGQWTAASFGAVASTTGGFAADLTATASSGALGRNPALASLSVKVGDFSGNITAQGAIGGIAVRGGDLTGNISTAGAVGNIAVNGEAGGQWNALRFGNITVANGNLSATITSAGAVGALSVVGGDLTGDLFAVGAAGNVVVKNVRTNGGNVLGATLTASGFGNISIAKNLTDSLILAGGNLGADHTLGGTGTNADIFAAGKIGAVAIGGSVEKSVIGGGLNPVDTEFKDGNDVLLGTARTASLKSFSVRGSLDADSFVGAYLLPAKVKIGTTTVFPIADARFLSHGSLGANFLTFKLVNDTGLYNFDAVSTDVAITGHLALTTGIAGFRAAIGNGALKTFAITPDAGGNFTLSVAKLNALNGSPLTDGTYKLRIETRGTDGGARESSFTFRLDTTAPTGTSVALSLASDTGTTGDGLTSASVVNLTGSAEPGARISVGGKSAIADNTGKFVLPNLTLADGANVLSFGITDLAGNTGTLNATFTKTAITGGTDVVLEWNTENLSAITRDASAPPVASRGLAMTSLAMFDVVSAFDGTAGYYTKVTAPAGASLEAAVVAAAHRVLLYLYPGQQTTLDAAFATSLARVTDTTARAAGVTFGESIASLIIAIRSNDGFDDFVNYTSGNLPGDWQTTAPMYDVALLPQWATLTPFALKTPEQFRPDGPPALDSATYATAFNEVKDIGSANSTVRTADQKQIARFWADGVGTVTPAGHWNQIASLAALDAGHSTAANARLLATLNVALADAAIACWDAKYFYETWRPITAIHDAENDGNAATVEDDAWEPLLITPPFPEYTSGHSTFSAAAADVLTSVFGANYDFTIGSPGLPNVTRAFDNFEEAAKEASDSRVFGGIHFSFATNDGLAMGDEIGDWVIARFNAGADTSAPLVMVDGLENGDVFATSPAITGHILDNLSGVATATAKFDKAAPVSLTLDATGKFTIPAGTLAHGAHTLVINATDAVGNAASPFTVRFTVDALDPTLTLNTGSGDILVAESRLTGRADGTGSPIVSLCYQFDGGPLIPILYDTATGAFDIQPDLAALAPGAHVLTLDTLDAAGHHLVKTVNVTLDARIPFAVTEHTPASFASEVGSTFRPQVFFSRPVDPTSLNAANFYATDTTGAKLPATIVPAQDGSFAWLFFPNPMPGASTVTVHVLGDTIRAAADQQPLDGDENGTPGGTLTYSFSTVSLTPLPGTSLSSLLKNPQAAADRG